MFRAAFPLFRIAGIQVYLHFTWFIVAWFQINSGKNRFHSAMWAVIEYVGLFALVLLHEFGHAFACRSTGGRADRIVLWPLGGLAFVNPPPRPGAVLWSIVAGPLVNVALYIPLQILAIATSAHGFIAVTADAHRCLVDIWFINLALLVFNLLPVYPLDGGQIVRALLWFKLGPIRSLKVSGMIGIVGAIVIGLLALWLHLIWTAVIAFFLFSQAAGAIQRAKEMQLAAETAAAPNEPPPIPEQRA